MVKKTETVVELLPLNRQEMEITLVGDSPLIVHAWSQKAKNEILDKQMKKAKAGREIRDPKRDFLDSMYWITSRPVDQDEAFSLAVSGQARFGFPSTAFKQVAVAQAHKDKGLSKVAARSAFHVNLGQELAEITGTPHPREDMVKVGMGTADIRFRAEFANWSVKLLISYNQSAFSIEQIVNLYNTAGFATGIGEWRAERDGQSGMFHVKAD